MRYVFFSLTIIGFGLLVSFANSKKSTYSSYQTNKDSLKLATFSILENKCNACHAHKKPTYVFTLENMEEFATIIDKQVFIKKKMPKGKLNDLTPEEEITLKNWLNYTLP